MFIQIASTWIAHSCPYSKSNSYARAAFATGRHPWQYCPYLVVELRGIACIPQSDFHARCRERVVSYPAVEARVRTSCRIGEKLERTFASSFYWRSGIDCHCLKACGRLSFESIGYKAPRERFELTVSVYQHTHGGIVPAEYQASVPNIFRKPSPHLSERSL